MNWLDVLIAVIAVSYAVAGYRAGFVLNLVEGLGLIVGGIVGVVLVPRVAGSMEPSAGVAAFSLLVVVGCGIFGQAIGHWVGKGFRVGDGGARHVNALGGAALGLATALVSSWAMGYAATSAQLPWVSPQARSSVLLATIDRAMPSGVTDAMGTFSQTLSRNVFPQYLDPFEREVITKVAPPDDATLARPEVKSARSSVTKIVGEARCGRGVEGSGFVYSRGRVMTNAHVVAGVRNPTVSVGGRTYAAIPVLYDPQLDIAVLRVKGLPTPPLQFALGGRAAQSAAVLGYPENGPFDARAARIRREINLRGPDIYNEGQIVRKAFSVRALVRSGNSGGPLVSETGAVLGVVFAASLTSADTGYALTAEQVQANATAGITATNRVSTGNCA